MKKRTPAKKSPAKRTVAVCINGRLRAPERATIAVDDWGFRYGWGAFESLRVHERRPLFLNRHLARLWRTVGLIGIATGVTPVIWERDIRKTISRARLTEGMINLYWTLGRPPDTAPVRIVSARSAGVWGNHRTLDAWVAPWRIEPSTPGIGAKTMAYFPNIFAAISARNEGYGGAIVLNAAGCVADGATASVFVIKGDRLATPRAQDGALNGITRGLILDGAREIGIPARECRISGKYLHDADAVLLTSALQGISVVRRLSGREQPYRPGPVARGIVQSLRQSYKHRILLELAAIPAAF